MACRKGMASEDSIHGDERKSARLLRVAGTASRDHIGGSILATHAERDDMVRGQFMACSGTGRAVRGTVDAAIAVDPLQDVPLRFSEVTGGDAKLLGTLVIRTGPSLGTGLHRSGWLRIMEPIVTKPAMVDTFGHEPVNSISLAELIKIDALGMVELAEGFDILIREAMLEFAM